MSIPSFDNVSVVKVLGIYFGTKMNWIDHFNFVIRKVSSRLYVCVAYFEKFTGSRSACNVFFYSLIQSILDYASHLFLNANAYLDLKFTFLCKRAFLIIHGFDVKSWNS